MNKEDAIDRINLLSTLLQVGMKQSQVALGWDVELNKLVLFDIETNLVVRVDLEEQNHRVFGTCRLRKGD